MKKAEVPQDNTHGLGGYKKGIYALDETGRYTLTTSSGWDAEEIVLQQAVADFNQKTQEALLRAQQQLSSPLEFHMFNRRMDIALLAQSTGFFKWQVKRHLTCKHFNKLNDKKLQRYAEALGLSVHELQTLPTQLI